VFIDTHTHLFLKQFDEDVQEVIERSKERGVEEFYLPNIDSSTIAAMYALCDRFPDSCFPMMGLHPCSVKENYKEELALLKAELDQRDFVAVGEIGLDFHWDKTFTGQQKDALAIQIGWAIEKELPIVLHTRESFEETLEIVSSLNEDRLTGVFHCYGESAEAARRVHDLGGFYVGIGGTVTFKNSGVAQKVAEIPLEWIVLETDSPYLAPTPNRGKRNESSYIPDIAAKIAEVKQVDLSVVEKITTENAHKLYKKVLANQG